MALLVSVKPDGQTSAKTLQEDSSGNSSVDSSSDLTYVVIADNSSQSAEEVMLSAGLPRIGSIRYGKKLKSVTATSGKPCVYGGVSTLIWEYTCKYESEKSEQQDPTELDPEISWTTETVEEVLTKDLNGNPIVNAVGDPILVTHPRTNPVATITMYKPETWACSASVIPAVNSNTFMGWRAGTALLKSIGVAYEKIKVRNVEKRFAKVTATIVFKDDGSDHPWRLKVLNQGMRILNDDTGEVEVYKDMFGNTGMVNLDADGAKLDDGDDPVFLEFKIYPEVAFNLNK